MVLKSTSTILLASVFAVWLLAACGSDPTGTGGGGVGELELFPPQEYSDDFDSGEAGRRWDCDASPCAWEVVSAGPLAPRVEPVAKDGSENFVLQSPDPLGESPNTFFRCDSFYADFEVEGTFAFNYFINTAGPIGPQDANRLRVVIYRHTVEFDEDFGEDIIIDTEIVEEWSEYGQVSSRFYRVLPAGKYEFWFCYDRNRSIDIGADYVQIDDVETCVGTDCIGEIPEEPRCQPDQGQILVPDIDFIPTHIISITRVQGTTNRFHVIINLAFLEFISGGLAGNSDWDDFRGEVDGVVTRTYVDGTTCELDQRTSLLIEMTTAEMIDYVIATGVITDTLEALEQAFFDAAGNAAVNALVQGIQEKFAQWVFTLLARLIP